MSGIQIRASNYVGDISSFGFSYEVGQCKDPFTLSGSDVPLDVNNKLEFPKTHLESDVAFVHCKRAFSFG